MGLVPTTFGMWGMGYKIDYGVTLVPNGVILVSSLHKFYCVGDCMYTSSKNLYEERIEESIN